MSSDASDAQSPAVSFERERGVYAIQVTRDVSHAVISVGDDALRTRRILQVFHVLGESSIAVFLFKLHRRVVTLAFAGSDRQRAEESLRLAGMEAQVRRDLAVVAVRAASMRDLSGIMVAIADALNHVGARVYETGDSHDSVQCLIEAARVPDAVQALCSTFHLDSNAISEMHATTGEAA